MEAAVSYEERLRRAMWGKLELKRSRLGQYQVRMQYLNPENRLRENRLYLIDLEEQIKASMERRVQEYRHALGIYLERFTGLSPLRKLNQGYSYVSDAEGKAVTSTEQVKNGDLLEVAVTDGTIDAQVLSVRREDRKL